MTWRMLVGGSRDGQEIDAEPAADRLGVSLTRGGSYDDDDPTLEMYLPQRWSLSVPHPCVTGLELYREWVLLVHSSLARWRPSAGTIATVVARAGDAVPDAMVIEPNGDVGPLCATWWDSAPAWSARLQEQLRRAAP